MIRMIGKDAVLLRGKYAGRTGTITHQSVPHPLSTHLRRWAIRVCWAAKWRTVLIQEDGFVVSTQ